MNSIRTLFYGVGVFFLMTPSLFAGYGYAYGGCVVGKVSILLLALAVGYWVLTVADKQKKPLDILGRIVGGIILFVSICGLLCNAICGICKWRSSSGKSCFYSAKKDWVHPSIDSAPVTDTGDEVKNP
ncbi:hypothetical protein BVX98_03105 [bacterium F11]|nr:hypothetical protein BVX98_03105 [bacterium F11]